MRHTSLILLFVACQPATDTPTTVADTDPAVDSASRDTAQRTDDTARPGLPTDTAETGTTWSTPTDTGVPDPGTPWDLCHEPLTSAPGCDAEGCPTLHDLADFIRTQVGQPTCTGATIVCTDDTGTEYLIVHFELQDTLTWWLLRDPETIVAAWRRGPSPDHCGGHEAWFGKAITCASYDPIPHTRCL